MEKKEKKKKKLEKLEIRVQNWQKQQNFFHFILEAQNAALNFNRQQEFSGHLSATAPEFIPKTIPPHEWHAQQQQQHPPQPGIEQPHQVYPYSAAGSRPQYVNHQQPRHIQQIPPQHLHQQQPHQQRQHHPLHQVHHQNHHIQHHQPHHFPNQQQHQQQQHMQQFMMMNNGNQHQDFHGSHRGGGGGGGGSIQNRLNAHQSPAGPQHQIPEDTGAHTQVSFWHFKETCMVSLRVTWNL